MTLSARAGARSLKFTREGKYFVLLTLGVGFAAINTANNLLYLVLGVCLNVIIASGILSEITLRRLDLKRRIPSRIYAAQSAAIRFVVTNHKRFIPSFCLELEEVFIENDESVRAKQSKETNTQMRDGGFILKIAPGRTDVATYPYVFAKRGNHQSKGIKVTTRFPFGLFQKSRFFALKQQFVVYPQIHAIKSLSSARPHTADRVRGPLTRSGEFYALRDFREGDDVRDVSWRKTAQLGRTIVKVHQRSNEGQLGVFLDNGGRAKDKRDASRITREEQAVSAAASLAFHHLRQGHAVAMKTRTTEIRFGVGSRHIDRILGMLAVVTFDEAASTDVAAVSVKIPRSYVYVSADAQGNQPWALD